MEQEMNQSSEKYLLAEFIPLFVCWQISEGSESLEIKGIISAIIVQTEDVWAWKRMVCVEIKILWMWDLHHEWSLKIPLKLSLTS